MTALQTALQVTLQSCHDCSSFIARSETSYCSKPQFLLCSLAHSHTHILVYASNVSVYKFMHNTHRRQSRLPWQWIPQNGESTIDNESKMSNDMKSEESKSGKRRADYSCGI